MQSDGGLQWGVVELGALWLCVRARCRLLGTTGPGVPSARGPAGSGSSTGQVFTVGLESGVPWVGGDGQETPRGGMVDGGKPARKE